MKGWISVDERLPEYKMNGHVPEECIGLTQCGTPLLIHYDYHGAGRWTYLNYKKLPHTVSIKYWMYVPDHPESESF